MYIEVIHDEEGHILGSYCCDTLPHLPEKPLFKLDPMPEGVTHARLNIDTAMALEIEAGSGNKAIIKEGKPELVNIDRATYIKDNLSVDMGINLSLPAGVILPPGMKLRAVKKKL